MRSHWPWCDIFLSARHSTPKSLSQAKGLQKKKDQHTLFFASLVRSKHDYRDCECQWRARNTIILLIPCRAHSIIHFLSKPHQQDSFDEGTILQKHFDKKESSTTESCNLSHMVEVSTIKLAELNEAMASFNIPNYFTSVCPKSANRNFEASSSTDIVNAAEGFQHRNEGQKERSVQTIEVPTDEQRLDIFKGLFLSMGLELVFLMRNITNESKFL